MGRYSGTRVRGSPLQTTAHVDTGLLDLSDELITLILAQLSFEELAGMHVVSQRFNRLLSCPDPSQKLYGSITVNVDRDRKGSLPPSMIERYLLTKRAAGLDCVCFQSESACKERQQDWRVMHDFFATSLPQLVAVFALYHVRMEIAVLGGSHIFFPNPQCEEEQAEQLHASEHYSEEYWMLMSLVLTKLTIQIEGGTFLDDMHWLCAMTKLQHLELRGLDLPDPSKPSLCLHQIRILRLPALKVLRLEGFEILLHCSLDCPSLEALYLRDLDRLDMPTGLASCSRLTILDVAAPTHPTHVVASAGLLAAIEAVQATLEVLDISGWAAYPGFDALIDLVSRLPRLHTLHAQRNGLTVVPALSATLKSLDLRANDFTEVPVQLESLTQLTSLALSSKDYFPRFQIERPLDALISLPQLRELTLVHDSQAKWPAHERWNAFSLYFLGLARHEIAKSKRSLLLKF